MKAKISTFFFILLSGFTFAQEDKFASEVSALVEKYKTIPWKKGGSVFTGSSSIKFWKTLEKDFPKADIVNTGFIGSQTGDLLQYLEELVIHFEPQKIFIYVGENDINANFWLLSSVLSFDSRFLLHVSSK